VSAWVGDDLGVVLVNAEQLAEGRDLGPTFEQQVSSADLLVLNQIDRVDPALLQALETRLRELEPEVPVVRAVQARIEPALLRPPDPRPGGPGRRMRAGLEPHAEHVHEDFEARELEVEAGIEPEALVARLRALGALRAKGWVETAAGNRLVQGVGRRVELEPGEPPEPGLAGRLVVIRRRAPG
jgi:cobalamin biosynthesis protein CobW